MRSKSSLPAGIAPQRRSLPNGAGFIIAGLASILFWALVAGIAAIA